MDAHNFTQQCDWLSEENQTEPRVTGRLDLAGCLFLTIIPNGHAVPALISVFVLLILFSFLINWLTLFGMRRSDDLSWEPRIAFLKNLIVSDLMQTVTISPTIIHSLVRRRTIEFDTWCYVQYFTGTITIFSSLTTITCMALERYLYVCHAIHYLVILTRMRLRLTLSLIWIFSISVSTINMVLLHTGQGRSSEPVTKGLLCEPDVVEQHMGFPRASAVFRKLVGSFTLLLCLLAHAFSYLRMYRDARNAVVPFKAVNTKAGKTVLYYCGMLFVQLLPLLMKVISDAVWEVEGTVAMMARSPPTQGDSSTKMTPSATAVGLHMCLLVMLVVPPCINPLVYMLRDAGMRQLLLSLFRSRMRDRRADVCGVDGRRIRDVEHRHGAQAG